VIHQLRNFADSAKLAVLTSWWIIERDIYDFENEIFEIRILQGLKCLFH